MHESRDGLSACFWHNREIHPTSAIGIEPDIEALCANGRKVRNLTLVVWLISQLRQMAENGNATAAFGHPG